MARKLFGTDGVRGVAGEELTAELALALGRSAAARVRWRASRVLVIRDTRESGEMLQAALAAGRQRGRRRHAARRGAADARRPAADRPLRLRPGGGDLGLPQPLPRQRHQVLRRRRVQALRRAGARDRARPGERHGGAAAGAGADPIRAACASCTAPARTTCASSTAASGSSTWAASTCCSTAPTAPPTAWPRRSSGGWAQRSPCSPTSPTGATSTTAAARPTSSASASGCARGAHDLGFAFDGDGDRVLAVDRDGEVVDGDELLALAALHLRASGRLAGRRRGRDGDDQLRLPRGDAAAGIEVAVHGRRRPLRARGAAQARVGARRRAVRSHHRVGLQQHRRRDRQRAADARGARRARPGRARRHAQAPPAARQRPVRDRGAFEGADQVNAGVRAAGRNSPAADGCWCAPAGPSRWCG